MIFIQQFYVLILDHNVSFAPAMKILKVTNDVHRAVKVKAAQSGCTTATLASQLIDHSLKEVEAGRLTIPVSEQEPDEEQRSSETDPAESVSR